jgi:hypothetical protein
MALQSLLKNKAFWLAVVALLQTILLNYLNVPNDIWISINAILMVLIAAFTIDDAARSVSNSMKDTILELRRLDKK